jgi:hypothetical protein
MLCGVISLFPPSGFSAFDLFGLDFGEEENVPSLAGLLKRLICFVSLKTPRINVLKRTPPLVDFSCALPLSLFEQPVIELSQQTAGDF